QWVVRCDAISADDVHPPADHRRARISCGSRHVWQSPPSRCRKVVEERERRPTTTSGDRCSVTIIHVYRLCRLGMYRRKFYPKSARPLARVECLFPKRKRRGSIAVGEPDVV